jgi:hypothetical protein
MKCAAGNVMLLCVAGLHAYSGPAADGRDDGGRAELLRGARPRGPPSLDGGPPGTRTAEEIKAAYGRPTHARRWHHASLHALQ